MAASFAPVTPPGKWHGGRYAGVLTTPHRRERHQQVTVHSSPIAGEHSKTSLDKTLRATRMLRKKFARDRDMEELKTLRQGVKEPKIQIVERVVEVLVDKIVEVPFETIKYVEKIVEITVEKRIEVPVEVVHIEYKQVEVNKVIEKIVEVPKYVEKVVEVPLKSDKVYSETELLDTLHEQKQDLEKAFASKEAKSSVMMETVFAKMLTYDERMASFKEEKQQWQEELNLVQVDNAKIRSLNDSLMGKLKGKALDKKADEYLETISKLRNEVSTLREQVELQQESGSDATAESFNDCSDGEFDNPRKSEDEYPYAKLRALENLKCPIPACEQHLDHACAGPGFTGRRSCHHCNMDLTGDGTAGRMSRSCSKHRMYLCMACSLQAMEAQVESHLKGGPRPDDF